MSDQIISAHDGYLLIKRAEFYGIITPKIDVWFNSLEEAQSFIVGVASLWAN